MKARDLRELADVGRQVDRMRRFTKNRIGRIKRSFRGERPDTFSEVLIAELDFFKRQGRFHSAGMSEADEKRPPIERAHRSQLVGLAFSGGGIRSATFNLGVLQALAHLGILHLFHYLSTVSGGGYIGSWLAAWIYRSELRQVEAHLYQEVPRSGADHGATREREDASPPEHERSPITFLRQFSNYLTPKTGALSVDTWTAVATYVRNLLLNLTIVTLALTAVLLVPRWVVAVSEPGWLKLYSFYFAAGLMAIAICGVAQNFDLASRVFRRRFTSTRGIVAFVIVPLFASGAFTSYGIALLAASGEPSSGLRSLGGYLGWIPWKAGRWAAVAGAGYFFFWLIALGIARLRRAVERGEGRWTSASFGWVLVMALLAGPVGGTLLSLLHDAFRRLGTRYESSEVLILETVWGPPAVVLIFILTAVFHIGLMGRGLKEEHREWWSRLGGWLCMLCLAWVALFGAAFYGPGLLKALGFASKSLIGAGWIAATAAGIWAGRSPVTGGSRSKRAVEAVAVVAPYLFVIGLVGLLSLAVHVVHRDVALAARAELSDGRAAEFVRDVERSKRRSDEIGPVVEAEIAVAAHSIRGRLGALTIALALVVGLCAFMSWRVDINEFSMHLFYRNRLIRPYLGASRKREHIPFTGFDPEDDLPLYKLCRKRRIPGDRRRRLYKGPLPVLNTTLNLASGSQLAWQERKAISFFFTPLYYGFDRGRVGESGGAFRPTRKTGGGAPVTLGTAMAISGAAVNPNMGYHSSPALAFLLTVFNTRLGWWFRNPARESGWDGGGPIFSLAALLSELVGVTGASSKFVNLADGGFFDNLGLYELVRRRCRFVLVCDAEADPDLEFNALGNAIRKCRSDFGIDIEIDVDPIRRDAATGFSTWHCAVGTIHYGRVDQDAPKGTLVYLKASLTGDEPQDLLNYARRFPGFPHESTADQWFGESQFESYRKLGYHQGIELFRAAGVEPSVEGGETREPSKLVSHAREFGKRSINVESVFVGLRQAWYPPSTRVASSFTRHSKLLDEIFERMRKDSSLAFLDEQIYVEIAEWKGGRPVLAAAPASAGGDGAKDRPVDGKPEEIGEEQLRQGFYLCNSMIQLMENVYLDLGLEHEWRHPDNRGWMNLFLHWSWAQMFRQTWAISASTYGARFQTFCQRRLGLELGMVWVEPLPTAKPADLDRDDKRELIQKWHENGELLGVEKRLLDSLAGQGDAVRQLYVLKQLVLRSRAVEQRRAVSRFEPLTKKPDPDDVQFEFTIGIAADREDLEPDPGGGERKRYIAFLRIRDHLRRLGLGRASILRLIADHGVVGARVLPDERLREFYRRVDRSLFGDLFKSVLNEYMKAHYGWLESDADGSPGVKRPKG